MKRTPLALLSVAIGLMLVVHTPCGWSASRAGDNLAALLGGLDPQRIPSGILYDRVLPLSHIEDHDGTAHSKPATYDVWKQMLFEMHRASLRTPSWPGLDALEADAESAATGGPIPVAVMKLEYNRIRTDAVESGALIVSGNRLVEGTGNPYVEHLVFAAAALRETTYRGSMVTFRLDPRWYVTNDGRLPDRIEIDFDDGRGRRPVAFGSEVAVHYSATGRKTVQIEMDFGAGGLLTASFYFQVASLQTPNPNDTLSVTATIPYNGEFGSGEAYVYLSDLHSVLTSPVIVVEGFDLDNTMNWDELYALLNQENLVETLRGDGYDTVVLNFTDATDYVQKNAFVVVELIEQVLALTGQDRDIAIVGASMGGLATRYALTYMEANSMPHNVRTFISFDAPQKGANIPLGIQYWLEFFSGQSADAAYLLGRLDRPASRQMLVYHHTDPPGITGESDPLRAGLESDMAAVGDYPAFTRLVAVANGSGSGADQGFAAGDQIIRYEYSSFLVDITGNVWAVPDATSHAVFDGLIDFILLPPDQQSVIVTGTTPYDTAPGGTRASMAQMDSTAAPYGDIVALHDSHCFIPTVSALALDTTDLFYDVAGDPDVLSKTPFDAVYFPQQNQPHVTITPENAVWFLSEIEEGITGVATGEFPRDRAGERLDQNVPNPFNPTTRIQFEVPSSGHVVLSVFDIEGREVARLADGMMPRGRHEVTWNGRNTRGETVASGVYFYRLRSGGFVKTRRMVLLK